MEDLVLHLRSISLDKFKGIFIAFAMVLVVLLIPVLPSWLAFFALYPLVTSMIDIVLYLRS